MLDHLPAGTQVNYGVFNEQIAFGNKFSSDPKELRDMLSAATDKLKKVDKGKTALFDAIHDGLGVFGPAQEGDTVLVITDGDDNRSGTTLTVLEKDLAAKAIRVFTILMWNDTARSQKQFGGGDPMQELAERTGGTEHTVNTKSLVWMEEKSSAPVRKDLQRFWHEEVLSAYALRFSVPPGTKEGQKWLLGVDRSANPKAKIVAAYPNRLHGCPSTTSSK
jgi:hypothetical protein